LRLRYVILGVNYYDFFDLAHKLDVDLPDLERRFHALSRKHHPDRFTLKSRAEQQQALDDTALLNDAYRTLRDPIKRAEYLLKEHGFDIGEQKSNNVPPELLEEVFALNMAMEEMDRLELEKSRQRFVDMQEELDRELAAKFSAYDGGGERDVLAEIRGLLNRRKYINNLIVTSTLP
jgi:molecular chaperone HscB